MNSVLYDGHSIWQKAERPIFPPLLASVSADVCVVGAGIAGLSVAYHLLKEGKSVVVLEREGFGLGETSLTSAHLSNALDETYRKLRRVHGHDKARLAAGSHTQAIDRIEQIVNQEGIACDFERVDGYLFLANGESMDGLREELEAAHASGLMEVELLENAPLRLFHSGPCLRYPRQGVFHPLLYLAGLARAIERMGGRIFAHTEAAEVDGGRVRTRFGLTVDTKATVVATNVPFIDRVKIQTKIAAHRTYMIAARIPHHRADNVLLWDTADPYHFVRLVKGKASGEDLLLIGGEDHRTGQDYSPADHHANLEEWMRSRLNLDAPVEAHWSGQIIEPVDGMAYIGRNPGDADNVYIVTGDSGHGLTHGTIAGILLTDLILGRENPWTDLYDPSRINLRSVGTYLKEVSKSTAPYTDWLVPGDVASIDEIVLGEGAVLRDGLQKIAVYKDISGNVHKFSAACPHLRGSVRWNSLEKTWDCPCHGSRFDKFGAVLNGPAASGLTPITDSVQGEPGRKRAAG